MDLQQTPHEAGPLPDWFDLPAGILESIIQQLHDSTGDRQDVLHALLVCKRWAAAAGALSYVLDMSYPSGKSLAYDLPGVAWLLRRSKQVAKLTLSGDSGAASGTLQALQWNSLREMELQGPEQSFGLDVDGDTCHLHEAVRGQQRAHVIPIVNGHFYLVATHPWEALPVAEQLPCLERLVIRHYALLDWCFPVCLRELELVMPSSGSGWEDCDGILWADKVKELQPLPALEVLRLELPLYDVHSLAECFGGDALAPPRVWPCLQQLSITMLHRDTEIYQQVFAVASLPKLRCLTFNSMIEHEHEWRALFVEGEVWPHVKHIALESSSEFRFQSVDLVTFPDALLCAKVVMPQAEG